MVFPKAISMQEVIYTSDNGDKTCDGNEKRVETIGERSMTIKKILYIARALAKILVRYVSGFCQN